MQDFHQIRLDRPPVVHQLALATHGYVPIETWRGLTYWSLHAYRYSARLRVGDQWHAIEPGTVTLLKPNVELEYRFRGLSTHTYAHFQLDQRMESSVTRLPLIIRLGQDFQQFDRDFTEASQWTQTQPARATARIWDLLWRLADLGREHVRSTSGHRQLDQAIEWIESRLADPIAVADLAARLEISHVHLGRLFRKHLNLTPLAYIHLRRAERAAHLLRHTTLPMKSIARQVGLVDLQQLNKLSRKVLHLSPTAIRAGR